MSSRFATSNPGRNHVLLTGASASGLNANLVVSYLMAAASQLSSRKGRVQGPLARVVPFISQITFAPVVERRQRMSASPSPLKSYVPTIRQLTSWTPGRLALPFSGARAGSPDTFSSQIRFPPSVLCRQTMSYLPSLSISALATICQLKSGSAGIARECSTAEPSISQTVFPPESTVPRQRCRIFRRH